jgi:outer membrane protein OmpA-like peptidoglycan-associated protein
MTPVTKCSATAFVVLASGAWLLALTGCAGVREIETLRAAALQNVDGPSNHRMFEVRQIGTGVSAHFARCLPPACPSVTGKTVASQAPVDSLANSLRSETPLAQAETVQADQVETAIVYFAVGSARLDRGARETLSQFAPIARQSHRMVVTGRTDNSGSESLNRVLAQARANAVAAYLRQLQTADHIEVESQGSCCYVARNDLEEGRQLNRRAEVSFHQIAGAVP